ncbi:hypothetical protein JB92DRAFT_3110938 [Gautieria morchelliformis]|nr:hypothetical protein JB92DRAFT_3110938 [Gautieria morchelliformis]
MPGRQQPRQWQDQPLPRPTATIQGREEPSVNACIPQNPSPTSQRVATRLREQEEEIARLRAEIAATAHRQQHQQPDHQPQQPDQQPSQQPQQQPNPPQPAADQQHERAEAQTEAQGALFADEEAIERARAAAKEDGKKAQLPDPIPGFKASMLDIAIPLKADEAFKVFRYIPYTALSLLARIKASRGEEDFIVNAQGGLTAKGLDHQNERNISTVEWYAAAKAAEERTEFHHGKTRAHALAAHHKIVMDLG